MQNPTIGIDVSKDHLDAHRLPDGTSRRFANSAKGLKALVSWIKDDPINRIVFEATGAYHRGLHTTLAKAGLAVCRVNPKQARRFAEAIGTLAKTDRVDAAMLARMGVALQPDITPPPDQAVQSLRDLHTARLALVKDRTAARNRLAIAKLPLIRQQLTQRLTQIQRQLKAIDQAIDKGLKDCPDLNRKIDILLSIPGVSTVTAVAILVEMPEIGTLDTKQAASLAGLAPIDRQSGTWRGKAHIKGGRATLRQALYMPALVASRFNPNLKAKYDALKAAGKPPKVAITALMRKLITLANALIKQDRTWMPNPA